MKSSGQKRVARQLMAGSVAVVVVATLYFFPPSEYSFYPRCVFHALTGWNCPGCGSLRAMHQLLHGNLAGAFQLNPALILFLPVLGIFVLRRMLRAEREN